MYDEPQAPTGSLTECEYTVDENLNQVIQSFHRARRNGDLFTTFYEKFFASSPEIPPLFVRTDFDRQKRMLRQSLLELLNFAAGIETAVEETVQLGRMHANLNIRSVHFDWWLDALLAALAEHDTEFTPELKTKWKQALQPGIEAMRQSMQQGEEDTQAR